MEIILSVLVLSALVKYIVAELKKQVIPAKWMAGITDVWGFAVALIICIALPWFGFLSEIIGDKLFTLGIGARIALAIIIAFGSGFLADFQNNRLNGK